MKKFFFGLAMLLSSSAMATEELGEKLAARIGDCEATNVVFINIQETAAVTIGTFVSLMPKDVQKIYLANEILFKRTAFLQRIQNDTFETTIPSLLAQFPDVSKPKFYAAKKAAYNKRIAVLVAEMQQIDPVDKKVFATGLNNAVDSCVEEFHPELP